MNDSTKEALENLKKLDHDLEYHYKIGRNFLIGMFLFFGLCALLLLVLL